MTDSHFVMEQTPKLSLGDFSRLGRLIYDICGIKMPASKKTMLEARLHKRLRALGFGSYADYCSYLFASSGEEELVRLINLITTNKTDFFREPEHFSYLAQYVLPEWLRGRGGGRRLRAWSAGCSSGEEPYTLAIVFNEFNSVLTSFDYRILATDISTQVLEKGLAAIYPEERVAPIPLYLKRKYLLRSKEKQSGLVRVVPELRAKVHFQRLNLMANGFSIAEQMDIIFCRNVIIYFDRPTQERLIKRFYDHLAPGGYLFVGHSETLSGLESRLTQVHPTVYRKAP